MNNAIFILNAIAAVFTVLSFSGWAALIRRIVRRNQNTEILFLSPRIREKMLEERGRQLLKTGDCFTLISVSLLGIGYVLTIGSAKGFWAEVLRICVVVFLMANACIPWFITHRFPEPVRSRLWTRDRQYEFRILAGRLALGAFLLLTIHFVLKLV